MGLLYYLSYAAVLAAFAFVTLSLASGLLYVSELIEEHSRIAKTIGQRGIQAIILLHAVLYFSDSLPLPKIIFSIICHVVYLQNFSATWPLISLSSLSFLASCILVIADHFLWFFHFAHINEVSRRQKSYHVPSNHVPGFIEIASFFGICVWLAPLFLFLSLSANDNALPMSSSEPGSPTVASMHTGLPRVSLFRSLISFDGLPRMRPKPARLNSSEGLLAPHSPLHAPASLPHHPPPSPLAANPRYGGLVPPRSPNLRTKIQEVQDLDAHTSPGSDFKLNTPPRRISQPMRRQTSDATGLGLRRTASSNMTGPDSILRED
ncbi:transmembrane adaptor Erv26-domain-containing protein [Infundibulicybe gibba]|nr:transmembrane adaptor Erv26-domain-containing protein [Infundibulicybe gibba]